MELDDGRLPVTDAREPTVLLLDLDKGGVQRLGREGQGPAEYQGAFSISRRADGSFGVYDARQARFFLVSGSGEVIGSERFERPSMTGLAPPRGTTLQGEGVIVLRSLDPGAGLRRAGIAWRWNTKTGVADSIGFVMQYEAGQEGRGITPMPRGDAWSALPDGSWARISADEYSVEWSMADGTVRRGSPSITNSVRLGFPTERPGRCRCSRDRPLLRR